MNHKTRSTTLRDICVLALALTTATINHPVSAVELIIGEEKVPPGITFIFEGAIRDTIAPAKWHLAENKTDVHIEARVNWNEKNLPKGGVPNGFVPYLDIVATIKNEKTGAIIFTDLLPHLNLIDNFHYARNIALPGKKNDVYTVTFNVLPPIGRQLGLHKDWTREHGNRLIKEQSFTYKKVNFKEIVEASR